MKKNVTYKEANCSKCDIDHPITVDCYDALYGDWVENYTGEKKKMKTVIEPPPNSYNYNKSYNQEKKKMKTENDLRNHIVKRIHELEVEKKEFWGDPVRLFAFKKVIVELEKLLEDEVKKK